MQNFYNEYHTSSLIYSLALVLGVMIYETVLHHISKHLLVPGKCEETVSLMFDILHHNYSGVINNNSLSFV